MRPYRFLSPAEEEMTEAALFYEIASSGLGSRFLNDVQKTVNKLSDYPHIGESVDSDLRRTPLYQFPFSLIYAFSADGIVIVAVAHDRQAPGYWRSRLN